LRAAAPAVRPDYQNPQGRAALATRDQTAMDLGPAETAAKAPWPRTLPDQIAAVSAALTDMGEATPDQIARRFARARTASIAPLLQALTALNHAREVAPGRYAP